jgi:hypothetical protein
MEQLSAKVADRKASGDTYDYDTSGAIFSNLTESDIKGSIYSDKESWLKNLKYAGVIGYDTGGYTGDFSDEKLAFLHQKELVLNQDDTSNILSAV